MTSDTMKSGVVESDRNKHESRQSFHRRKMTSKTAPILNGSDEQVVNNNAAAATTAAATSVDYLHDHDHHQQQHESMMVRQQVNLAAAYHDHISCTKSSADLCNKIVVQQETSNRIMNLPCETDHIYANCGDKSNKVHNIINMSAPSKEWDGEKRQLYDMCLLQLELLKRIEEQSTAKDKQIQTLKQENETLKVRQERMERRMCLLKRNARSDHDSDGCLSDVGSIMSDSQLPSASGAITATVPAVITSASSSDEPCNAGRSPVHLVTRYLGRRSKTVPLRALKRRYLGPPKSFPCKRPAIKHLPSTTSASSPSESVEEEKPVIKDEICSTSVVSPSLSVQTPEAETTKITRKKSKRHKTIPIPEDFLTTDIEYYLPDYSRQDTLDSAHTIDGDDTESTSLLKLRGDTDKKEDVRLSVPSWRYKPVSSFYQMEGTENIDDRVFHRRHLKCEQDEKRRKRWDIQRLREQRASEKLKYKKHSGSKNDDEQKKSISLYPDPKQIEKIEVTERLPVTAFGVPIPLFQPSEFSLPWKVEPDSKDAIAANSDGSKVT